MDQHVGSPMQQDEDENSFLSSIVGFFDCCDTHTRQQDPAPTEDPWGCCSYAERHPVPEERTGLNDQAVTRESKISPEGSSSQHLRHNLSHDEIFESIDQLPEIGMIDVCTNIKWPEAEENKRSRSTSDEQQCAYHPPKRMKDKVTRYQCGYCGSIKTSCSQSADGRVRIRCGCGGQHRDNRNRLHATWAVVKNKPVTQPCLTGFGADVSHTSRELRTQGVQSDGSGVQAESEFVFVDETNSFPKCSNQTRPSDGQPQSRWVMMRES